MLFVSIATIATAQKMKVVSGNFDFLKGQNELNLVMDYSEMKFYKENMTEEAYIKKRENDISADKGSAEAEKWKNDWEHSKNNTFVEKFLASMNKNTSIKTSELQSKLRVTPKVEFASLAELHPIVFDPKSRKPIYLLDKRA